MLTVERLRQVIGYSCVTGKFTWRAILGQRTTVGDEAGSLNEVSGYIRIQIDGELYPAHRLAVFYVTGEWPEKQIDHRNRIRHDNRWGNLRGATNLQNQQNRSKSVGKASKYLGVTWDTRKKMWRSRITCNSEVKPLGYFDDECGARDAYLAGKKQYHQFSTVNDVVST